MAPFEASSLSYDAETYVASDATGAWGRKPRLSWADLVLYLWRAKWLMIGVAAPILVLGAVAALLAPKSYEAVSRLYVGLGQEYVFQPLVGDAARGAIPEGDRVMQAEIELLSSPIIAERVMDALGLEQIYPDTAEAISEAPEDRRDLMRREAVVAMQRDFSAGTAPKTPVIRTAFEHEDPIVAAAVLNAMIDTYISYRREVLIRPEYGAYSDQRIDFARRLRDKETEIQRFLVANSVSDFDAERGAAQALLQELNEQLLTVEAGLREAQGRYDALTQRLITVPETIELFQEDNNRQRLLDLQVQRRELLSRYREGSIPVQEIDRRIEQTSGLLEAGASTAGTQRRGPNPVHQQLLTERLQVEAQVRSQSERAQELRSQRERLNGRLSTMTQLAPEYQRLLRERDVLESNVRAFASREEEERALSALASRSAENIRIMEPALPPPQGSSLRLPIAAAAVLLAGLTALLAGLAFALTRETMATSMSVARTLNAPALAVVGQTR